MSNFGYESHSWKNAIDLIREQEYCQAIVKLLVRILPIAGPAPNRDGPLLRSRFFPRGNCQLLEVPRSEFIGCARYSWKLL